jgi:hypothetical protein
MFSGVTITEVEVKQYRTTLPWSYFNGQLNIVSLRFWQLCDCIVKFLLATFPRQVAFELTVV